MKLLDKKQIKDLTYDGQIIESGDNISGFVIVDGKKELRIWVLFDGEYYTDDWNFGEEWTASRNNITVNEFRLMKLKEKQKVYSYLPQNNKKNKSYNKKEIKLIDKIIKIKKGFELNNK